jgi:hypothetical protein
MVVVRCSIIEGQHFLRPLLCRYAMHLLPARHTPVFYSSDKMLRAHVIAHTVRVPATSMSRALDNHHSYNMHDSYLWLPFCVNIRAVLDRQVWVPCVIAPSVLCSLIECAQRILPSHASHLMQAMAAMKGT